MPQQNKHQAYYNLSDLMMKYFELYNRYRSAMKRIAVLEKKLGKKQ